MLVVGLVLILLHSCHQCFGSECPYHKAQEISNEKRVKYEALYQDFHMTDDNFDAPVNSEFDPTAPYQSRAYDLLEFQYLVKENAKCSNETFQECLDNEANEVPEEGKCQPLDGPCNEHDKYAPIDGYCNNLKYPNYGKIRTAYKYMLNSSHSDGIREFRKSVSGEELPNPRAIGNAMNKSSQNNHFSDTEPINNFAGFMHGQLLTHDIANRQSYTNKGNITPPIRCCTQDYTKPLDSKDINPNCIPVSVPSNDPSYAATGVGCLNYIRMAPTLDNHCKIAYMQSNDASSFLDLSIIYSINTTNLNKMRKHSGGLFQMSAENVLPLDSDNSYIAGDERFDQTTMLTFLHSLYYRQHNIIANGLSQINSHWNDSKLFFEARRINIAIYQHIIYDEWLPAYLGLSICKAHKLICGGTHNPCDEYSDDIDPSVSVEFSVNAFRFFHKSIPSTVEFIDAAGKIVNKTALSDLYLITKILEDANTYDNLARGLLGEAINVERLGYSAEVRNLLFKQSFKGQQVGTDLLMFDVMRSRDAGTAPYYKYYSLCLSKKISSWDDLTPYFEQNHLNLLKTMYDDVKDVDLMVGMLLERHNKSRIGAIGGCLIAEQFYRLKYGDRFFYTHSNNPHKFTSGQLSEISKMSLGKLFCMVTNLEKVPTNSMITPASESDYVDCKDMNQFNFGPFKEEA